MVWGNFEGCGNVTLGATALLPEAVRWPGGLVAGRRDRGGGEEGSQGVGHAVRGAEAAGLCLLSGGGRFAAFWGRVGSLCVMLWGTLCLGDGASARADLAVWAPHVVAQCHRRI